MSYIFVIVSVDWEGSVLLDENLQTIKEFRKGHPDVPMQQFLNAAYYTKEDINPFEVTKKINSVLLPFDDHGLHVHAWKSLLIRAGVAPRKEPNYFSRNREPHEVQNDWGHEIGIHHFETEEISAIVETSIDILTSQGFGRPESFRAGGWLAGQHVLEALVKNNFKLDASAVNHRFIKTLLGEMPLYNWITELWPDIHDGSMPYQISTDNGILWEFPNNGCLADYTTAEEILEVFEKNVQLWTKSRTQDVFVSIGFHQETANKFLGRLDEGVVSIKKLAEKHNLPVVFIANPLPHLR